MPNPDTQNWTYAMEDTALLEGRMTAVYPMGVNVLLVRVDNVVHAVSGKCVHMACPLFTGKLAGHTVTCLAIKRCWCGLFVHKDVVDPRTLPQLTPKDAGLE